MSLSAKLRRAPLRLAAGAYILNSGVTKLNVDDETAKSLHGMASGTYPILGKLEPKVFARTLAVGEITVGTMLLVPIVPPFIAGAALVGFSGAQLNMYWHTPGMHHEGSLRPTPQGTPISETVWMLGIGVGLMTDATLEGAREGIEEIEASVARRRVEWGKRAQRLVRRGRRAQTGGAESVKHVAQRAGDASEATAKRLAEIRAGYGPIAAEKARTGGEAVRHAAAEYAPVAAEKVRTAGEAVQRAAAEYAPVAAEKVRTAGEAVQRAAAEYAPVAAEKVRTAGDAVQRAAAEYAPVAAEKVRTAGDAVQRAAAEYAPVAAEKVRTAGEAVQHAAAEYGPIAAEKMEAAGRAAQEHAMRARERLAS